MLVYKIEEEEISKVSLRKIGLNVNYLSFNFTLPVLQLFILIRVSEMILKFN